MTDITDKYEKYKVPYSTNEKHAPDEFDPKAVSYTHLTLPTILLV